MGDRLAANLDFVFLCYGFAFLLITCCAYVVWVRFRERPWIALALFGLLHGLHEWLELVALSYPDAALLAGLRIATLAGSLLLLLEFVRALLLEGPGRLALPRILYCFPLASALLGHAQGPQTAELMLRYLLAFPASLLAAYALARRARGSADGRPFLAAAAGGFIAYAVFAGLFVARSEAWPSNWLNQDNFALLVGLPVQVARGAVAVFIAAAIGGYAITRERASDFRPTRLLSHGVTVLVVLSFAAALMFAWFLCRENGRDRRRSLRDQLFLDLNLVALTFHHQERGLPSGQEMAFRDLESLEHVRRAVLNLTSCVDGFAGFFIYTLRHGELHCAASYPDAPADMTSSDLAAVADPSWSVRMRAGFARGEPFLWESPDQSSAHVPIWDQDLSSVKGFLRVDVDRSVWQRDISRHRLLPLAACMMVLLLLCGLFVAYETAREAFHTIASAEQKYESLLLTLPAGLALCRAVRHADGRLADIALVDANEAFSRLTRAASAGDDQRPDVPRSSVPTWPRLVEACREVEQTGAHHSFIAEDLPSGRICEVAAYAPHPGYFALVLMDITDRRLAEEQLRLQSAALQYAANAVVITDTKGICRWVNPAFTRLTGYAADEIMGRDLRALKSGKQDDVFYKQMWETIQRGDFWQDELVNRRKDGTLYEEEMTIAPVKNSAGVVTHYVAIKLDISERKRLQEQLIHAQRLESVGTLAGGIAHDFNNLLQAILGFAEMLQSEIPEGDAKRADVDEITKAATRAAALTARLLAFSRKQVLAPRTLDLNGLVKDLEPMLRQLIANRVSVRLSFDAGLWSVHADPTQMEQIIMNLAVNSRDAMPTGGEIEISTRNVVVKEGDLPEAAEARPGSFVCLSVADTGVGMSPEVRRRLFEPFFTTKEKGRGTGLGLATVYGLVRQHGGWVDVNSEVGVGTQFHIYLPAMLTVQKTEAATGCAQAKPGSARRILVVEDELGVCQFAVRTLRKAGYEVQACINCREAQELFQKKQRAFDLVFSDIVLPDGNGYQLVDRLLKLKPSLSVVFASGFVDEKARSETLHAQGFRFLPKPYTSAQLTKTVRDALAAASVG